MSLCFEQHSTMQNMLLVAAFHKEEQVVPDRPFPCVIVSACVKTHNHNSATLW